MLTVNNQRFSREMPFTYHDKQVLDEMFKNFDMQRRDGGAPTSFTERAPRSFGRNSLD